MEYDNQKNIGLVIMLIGLIISVLNMIGIKIISDLGLIIFLLGSVLVVYALNKQVTMYKEKYGEL